LLQFAIIHDQGEGSVVAAAVGRDGKGKISPVLYAAAVPLAFAERWISVALYVAVAGIWLIPDRRIENRVVERTGR
jgi:uncharacterized membrane protein